MDKELLKWGIEHSDPEKLKEKSEFDPAKLVALSMIISSSLW